MKEFPAACGCYVFALKNGGNIIAWYVGKTERMTFEKECFQATNEVDPIRGTTDRWK